jgi:polyhydroxyalkanoate synthesis regulator phasin
MFRRVLLIVGRAGYSPDMAKQQKDQDHGVVGRLAERGEGATNRLLDALGSNTRLTDALARATSAKGKLDSASKGALSQIGLAPADDVKDLRKKVERLEKRLAKLEASGAAGKPSAKRSETKKRSSAKRRTTRTSAAEAGPAEDKAQSPAPGRSLGGSVARGSGTGGAAARSS